MFEKFVSWNKTTWCNDVGLAGLRHRVHLLIESKRRTEKLLLLVHVAKEVHGEDKCEGNSTF